MRNLLIVGTLVALATINCHAQDQSSLKTKKGTVANAKADTSSTLRVKVIFDDSKGMCGYLGTGSAFNLRSRSCSDRLK